MIILNELKYAEKCIKENYIDKKPFFTLNILAKYYYHLGNNEVEIVELLKDYAKETCSGYSKNKFTWDTNIAKMVKTAIQYPLYQIEGVWITSKELSTIRSIHNKVLERLAFTLLCLAKYNIVKNPKSDGWINYESKEIFSLARISSGIDEREIKFHELYKLGLIDFAKRIDNLGIRVKYISDDDDNVLFISDFRELGYEYLLYRGENFIRCGECGILTRGNKAGTKRYCVNCAGHTPQVTKKIQCIDCGDIFEVDAKNTKSTRCVKCQSIINREKKRIWKQNNTKTEKVETANLG